MRRSHVRIVLGRPNNIGSDKIEHLSVEGNMLVLRKPKKQIRAGWAKDAMAVTASKQNSLVLGDFVIDADEDWDW